MESSTPQIKHTRWVTPPPEGWDDRPRTGSGEKKPSLSERLTTEPVEAAMAPAAVTMEPVDQTMAPARPRRRIFSVRTLFRDVVFPLLIAFTVAMFAQATLAKPYQIPSGSMLPSIQLQDRILANRFIYRIHAIERGDVIVFIPPAGIDQSTPYVKRVIGLPGDTVEVRNGKTFVNDEEFVVPAATIPSYTRRPEVVPDGSLFVLGDNRNESADSHIWGYVAMDNVIGRADVVYWPPKDIHLLGL
jgi:signal peptidase I